ncbi:hypothetical protein F5X99DRAFT_365016 [Biscogniauxia marginata]|nr:hypothetical protein F5X99DRAFT_365016 [Biscogniauxia marginata]
MMPSLMSYSTPSSVAATASSSQKFETREGGMDMTSPSSSTSPSFFSFSASCPIFSSSSFFFVVFFFVFFFSSVTVAAEVVVVVSAAPELLISQIPYSRRVRSVACSMASSVLTRSVHSRTVNAPLLRNRCRSTNTCVGRSGSSTSRTSAVVVRARDDGLYRSSVSASCAVVVGAASAGAGDSSSSSSPSKSSGDLVFFRLVFGFIAAGEMRLCSRHVWRRMRGGWRGMDDDEDLDLERERGATVIRLKAKLRRPRSMLRMRRSGPGPWPATCCCRVWAVAATALRRAARSVLLPEFAMPQRNARRCSWACFSVDFTNKAGVGAGVLGTMVTIQTSGNGTTAVAAS